MSGKKGSGKNLPSGEILAREAEKLTINPLPPSQTSHLFDPHAWDGAPTRHVGLVVSKSSQGSRVAWIKIFSPTLNTNFYSRNNTHTPIHTMVTCYQTQSSFFDNRLQLMVNNVSPLSRAEVITDNKGGNGARAQTWGQGWVKSMSFGKGRYGIDVKGSNGAVRSRLLPFDPSTLHQGSQILPPGSPVFFQTAFVPHGKKVADGKPEVMSLTYDTSRYHVHAGPMPSHKLLDHVEEKLGTAHLLFGIDELIDPRGVSIEDLVKLDDPSLDRTNLASLVTKGLKVLLARLDRLKLDPAADKPRSKVGKAIFAINNTTYNHSTKPLVIFATPNFFTRKTWLDMTNRHFSHNHTSNVIIHKVRILEMVGASLNALNVGREAGLLGRHTEEWRVPDHQDAHQLFSGAGPFTQITDTITPPSSSSPSSSAASSPPSQSNTRSLHDTNHHENHQLLVTSLSPTSRSLAEVPGTLVTTEKEVLTELGEERNPSLLVVFGRYRAEFALKALRDIQADMHVSMTEDVHCADTRMRALRLSLPGACKAYIEDMVSILNDPSLDLLLHAGDYDSLHQDTDDDITRTLLCKSGYNPSRELMLTIDPNIQYRLITQGIMRIISKLDTTTLITSLRTANEAFKATDKQEDKRGERAIFQAVNDDKGLHWVGTPPSPPTRRGANPWQNMASTVFEVLQPPVLAGKHRVIIKGPAPSWTPKMLKLFFFFETEGLLMGESSRRKEGKAQKSPRYCSVFKSETIRRGRKQEKSKCKGEKKG